MLKIVDIATNFEEGLLSPLVKCYQEVFSAEPWREWKKCSVCGQKWGIEERPLLEEIGFSHCQEPLDDFWPEKTVREDIKKEITPESSAWVAVSATGRVVGFCWGYPISDEKLAEKIGLPSLAEILRAKYPLLLEKGEGVVGYQDEIGVVKDFRRQGLAKILKAKQMEDFRSKGLTLVACRTQTQPPTVTLGWDLRLGYEVVARYSDQDPEDSRVILARPLAGLIV